MKNLFLSRRALLSMSLGLGASILLAGASGCNNNSGTSAANNGGTANGGNTNAPGKLVIISPHNAEIRTEFEQLWAKSHPQTSLQWLDQGGTSDDLRFVREQFAQRGLEKGIGVDVFFGGGGDTFAELADAELLAPLESTYGVPAELNGVPLVGEDKSWVAAALSGFGILYNKPIAARDNLPVPEQWQGLADPKLYDRVGLADPRKSGSAHTVYEIILQTNGWEKGWKILTAMGGNTRKFSDSASGIIQDAQNGEAVFVTAIDFYAANAINQAGEDKLGYIEPKGQAVVTADPIGILKSGPNAAAARQFVDMVMSEEGQKLWFLNTGQEGGPANNTLFRLPALPAAYEIQGEKSIEGKPYDLKTDVAYDEDKAAVRRRALDDLIGTVLIDNHTALKNYWKANPDLEKAGFVPISEAEFMKIAPKWNEARVANEWKTKWDAAARAKYNS